MYIRKIDNEVTTFGVSGSLWREAMVMYDRKTESLWSQISGKSIKGANKGKKLKSLPIQMMKWSQWKEIYPDSKVLKKDKYLPGSHYEKYFASKNRLGIHGRSNIDERLDGKDIVWGMIIDDIPTVFPHKFLLINNLLNYKQDKNRVLVIHDPKSESTFAFNAVVDGKNLTFSTVKSKSSYLIKDSETKTTWDGYTGKAIKGKLKGQQLEMLTGTQAFWFGWRGFYPRTIIWEP